MLDRREGPRKCSFYKVHSKPVLAVKLSERQVFIENLFLQTLEAFNRLGVELVRGSNTGDIRQSCWQKVEKGSQHRGLWLSFHLLLYAGGSARQPLPHLHELAGQLPLGRG